MMSVLIARSWDDSFTEIPYKTFSFIRIERLDNLGNNQSYKSSQKTLTNFLHLWGNGKFKEFESQTFNFFFREKL